MWLLPSTRYSTRPLLSKHHIRLLQFPRGEPGDPIEGVLKVVSLDDNPQYDAISYAWGQPHQQRTIILNRGTVGLGHSLYMALCTDQSDDKERSSLVKMMTDIYSHARRTLIWLSNADEVAGAETLESLRALGMLFAEAQRTAESNGEDEWQVWTVMSVQEPEKRECTCPAWDFPSADPGSRGSG